MCWIFCTFISSSIWFFALFFWYSPRAAAFPLSLENSLKHYQKFTHEINYLLHILRSNGSQYLYRCNVNSYPDKTPRMRFITKNAPNTTNDTKYAHCHVAPIASWYQYNTSVHPYQKQKKVVGWISNVIAANCYEKTVCSIKGRITSNVMHWKTVSIDTMKLSKLVIP